jgi:hypothetical protein
VSLILGRNGKGNTHCVSGVLRGEPRSPSAPDVDDRTNQHVADLLIPFAGQPSDLRALIPDLG